VQSRYRIVIRFGSNLQLSTAAIKHTERMVKEYNYSDEREFLESIRSGPTDLLQYIKRRIAHANHLGALVPY